MSKFFAVILALFACASLTAFSQETPSVSKLTLTLEDAKRIALEQNPTLAVARANIRAAMASVQSARSAYYPTLDLSAKYTRLRDNAQGRFNRDFDNTDKYDAGFSANWLLFNGGVRRYNELIAVLGGKTALSECADAKRILLENVAKAFYMVIEAQNSMDISKQDAEFNRQLERDASERNKLGTAKASEVLNFQYQVESAEANYITAESVWRNACVTLGQLLVINQENIWDNIELVCPDESVIEGYDADVNKLIAYAQQHRPDLRKAKAEVRQAEYGIKSAESEWAPKVNAFYNFDFTRTHAIHFNRHYDRSINFGVAASWNLFSGFATEAAISKAKASRQMALESLKRSRIELEAEIRSDVVSFETSKRRLAQQTKLHEIAQNIRDLVREEYLGGTATITRLNEVQTNLTNAALAVSNAHVAVLNNLETLKAATSENLLEFKPVSTKGPADAAPAEK